MVQKNVGQLISSSRAAIVAVGDLMSSLTSLQLFFVHVIHVLVLPACISARAEADPAAVQAEAGERAGPRQLPPGVHRRAGAAHARQPVSRAESQSSLIFSQMPRLCNHARY